MKISKILLLISAGLIFAFNNAYSAQFDPTTKPIELVVPTPPGGAIDLSGRIISKIFEKHGWKSVVVNKAGADQSIGVNYVANAPADGNTLLVGGTASIITNVLNPNKHVPYKYEDFDEVVLFSKTSLVLYTRPELNINTFEEFKQWAKLNPTQYKIGVWSLYSAALLNDINQKNKLPTPIVAPYKGSSQQIADLIGGNINFMVDSYPASKEMLSAGKITPLLVFDKNNFAQLSKVKVVTDDDEFYIWSGIYCPQGTPPEVINQINQVINEGFKDPEIKKVIQ